MIDKLSLQQRVIIATILSFGFFMVYGYYFTPPPTKLDNNQSIEKNQTISTKAPVGNQTLQTKTVSANINEASEIATNKKFIATIKSNKYEAKIDNLGRIAYFKLLEEKYKDEDGKSIEIINDKLEVFPLEIRLKDDNLNHLAFKINYTSDIETLNLENEAKTITLTQNLNGFIITKKITFFPHGLYKAQIQTNQKNDFFITMGSRPNVLADGYTFHGALLSNSKEELEVLDDGDVEASENFANITMAAMVDRYYANVFFDYNKPMNVIVSNDGKNNASMFINANESIDINGFIGPKEHKLLSSIDQRLESVIEYGWFTFIAKPVFMLLNYIHKILGNWGWSIVLMTLLIRLVLFPLTYKGMVSMNKLKELAPKMKELQAKYKDDKQKLNMHMMEMYKKHGANPMGGCLPILLQIPVFFAIYRVLLNAIELKAAPWILWIHDLSVMDPYFILPIAMGLTMFLQQKITPANFTDPMQEKIMKYLPLVFTFFFVTFPAGLTLYWFINNLFSISQQYYVNKLFENKKLNTNTSFNNDIKKPSSKNTKKESNK